MLSFSKEEQVATFGIHPESLGGNKCSARLYSIRAFFAFWLFSPSDLVIEIASAISFIHIFFPCSSSPAPACMCIK